MTLTTYQYRLGDDNMLIFRVATHLDAMQVRLTPEETATLLQDLAHQLGYVLIRPHNAARVKEPVALAGSRHELPSPSVLDTPERFYPCAAVGPCLHLGSHHTATGRCMHPGCACTGWRPLLPQQSATDEHTVQERESAMAATTPSPEGVSPLMMEA